MATIHPFLWFNGDGAQARDFYLSVFRNGKALSTTEVIEPDGTVANPTFDFELEGLHLTTFNAGAMSPFNERMSLYIETKDQAETDYYYAALIAGGGSAKPCGWLVDRFGVYWQVIPEIALRLMAEKDHAKAGRARQAMYGMHKIVIADLEAAYAGKA
jgi:predicted 3-demethylubiquinone-9 3-methyltransferase (glyoxalase superfamily)